MIENESVLQFKTTAGALMSLVVVLVQVPEQ